MKVSKAPACLRKTSAGDAIMSRARWLCFLSAWQLCPHETGNSYEFFVNFICLIQIVKILDAVSLEFKYWKMRSPLIKLPKRIAKGDGGLTREVLQRKTASKERPSRLHFFRLLRYRLPRTTDFLQLRLGNSSYQMTARSYELSNG